MGLDTGKMNTIPKARWGRIIPPTIIIYIISYMDRMNISFAMAGGMSEELGMSMTVSGLAAGIFFFGYLVLQVPGGHIAEHKSAKRFIMWSIIGWGFTSMLTGLAQNEWQLLAARFALGVAEGGVFPAVLVILSNWFPRNEIGRANALFVSSMAISSAITNPFSGWIVADYGWRYLFFTEGAISLLLIFVWLPLISDRPEEAKWISKEEKEYLVNTLRAEKEENAAAMPAKKWTFTHMLTDKTLWIYDRVLHMLYGRSERLFAVAADNFEKPYRHEYDLCGISRSDTFHSGHCRHLYLWFVNRSLWQSPLLRRPGLMVLFGIPVSVNAVSR